MKVPLKRSIYSLEENDACVLTKSNPVAASIVGTASKKENSTAVFLLIFNSNAPMIVAAALETPGIMEIDWKRPM